MEMFPYNLNIKVMQDKLIAAHLACFLFIEDRKKILNDLPRKVNNFHPSLINELGKVNEILRDKGQIHSIIAGICSGSVTAERPIMQDIGGTLIKLVYMERKDKIIPKNSKQKCGLLRNHLKNLGIDIPKEDLENFIKKIMHELVEVSFTTE